jgi:hypothetical protein
MISSLQGGYVPVGLGVLLWEWKLVRWVQVGRVGVWIGRYGGLGWTGLAWEVLFGPCAWRRGRIRVCGGLGCTAGGGARESWAEAGGLR